MLAAVVSILITKRLMEKYDSLSDYCVDDCSGHDLSGVVGDVVTALAISLLAGNMDSTRSSRAICNRWRLPALELGIGSSASFSRGSLSKPGAADRSAAWSVRLARDPGDYGNPRRSDDRWFRGLLQLAYPGGVIARRHHSPL
jgi:hypothetical protein